MFIDHRFFPHIIDTILSYSSIDVLHTFYDLSAKYERRVLTYFPTHIVIELDEDGGCLLQSRDLGTADQWTVLHYGLDDISIGTDSPDREELFWQKVLEQAGIVDIMGLRFVGDLDSGIYPALSSARTVRYHSASEVNPITAEALVLFADLISVSHAPAMTLRGKEEDTPCPTSITLSLDCHIDPLAVQTGYPLFDPLTCSIRQSYEQRFREPAIVTIVLQDKRKGRRSKPAQDPSTDVLRGYLCNLGAKGKTDITVVGLELFISDPKLLSDYLSKLTAALVSYNNNIWYCKSLTLRTHEEHRTLVGDEVYRLQTVR